MTRVFVVAKIRLYREGLAHLLGREPGIVVVGTFEDYRELVEQTVHGQVDVVLIDPTSSESLAAISNELSATSSARLLALGMTEDAGEVIAGAAAGVSGFVHRDDSVDDVLIAIDRVARGEIVCSPRIAAAVVRHVVAVAAAPDGSSRATRLTRREREIVGLIEEGLSNKQIARRLQIELATVKNHVHNILEKLNVHSRLEAAAQVRRMRIGRAAQTDENALAEARATLPI
jgi:DNA-binding NarL/FixJ family response regulator